MFSTLLLLRALSAPFFVSTLTVPPPSLIFSRGRVALNRAISFSSCVLVSEPCCAFSSIAFLSSFLLQSEL